MKFLCFFVFFIFTHAALSAMHGKNDIWEAPDDLICLPWSYDSATGESGQKVDAQLSNLIKRSGMTYAGNIQGSAFIVGEQCDKIISTKHTLNHMDGSKRGTIKPLFYRNVYEANKKINEKNRQAISIQNISVKALTDLNDRKISQLDQSAIDGKLGSCPKVPILSSKELKNNLDDIQICVVLSFNQDIANPDTSMRSTMTMMSHQGLKRVNSRTRGITSCQIEGFAYDGMIETNCDTIYSASGSPFFCKVESGGWKLAGIHVSDTCFGSANYNNCLNPNAYGKAKHESLMLPLDEELIQQLEQK
jgi:hypothetical protein